jgi:hypothetical protein
MGLSIKCVENDNPDCINRNKKKTSFEAAHSTYLSPASDVEGQNVEHTYNERVAKIPGAIRPGD